MTTAPYHLARRPAAAGGIAIVTQDHLLFGWHIRSEIPLPEVPVWNGPAGHQPDVIIRVGPVPHALETAPDETTQDAAAAAPFRTVEVADGRVLIRLKDCGEVLVTGGREIVVSPATIIDTVDIRTYLLGIIMGALCHQRGEIVLHAACLRIGDQAVAITGASGAGKSTLAASLIARGLDMLADDLTMLRIGEDGCCRAWPAYPRMRLWQDAADRRQIDTAALDLCISDLTKFQVPVDDRFVRQPLPLAAVVHLDRCDDPADEGLFPLRGLGAAIEMRNAIYRPGIAVRLGLQTAVQVKAARLAALIPHHMRLTRFLDDLSAERAADRLLSSDATGMGPDVGGGSVTAAGR